MLVGGHARLSSAWSVHHIASQPGCFLLEIWCCVPRKRPKICSCQWRYDVELIQLLQLGSFCHFCVWNRTIRPLKLKCKAAHYRQQPIPTHLQQLSTVKHSTCNRLYISPLKVVEYISLDRLRSKSDQERLSPPTPWSASTFGWNSGKNVSYAVISFCVLVCLLHLKVGCEVTVKLLFDHFEPQMQSSL